MLSQHCLRASKSFKGSLRYSALNTVRFKMYALQFTNVNYIRIYTWAGKFNNYVFVAIYNLFKNLLSYFATIFNRVIDLNEFYHSFIAGMYMCISFVATWIYFHEDNLTWNIKKERQCHTRSLCVTYKVIKLFKNRKILKVPE